MQYFTTGEVASLIGVSKRTLQKWLEQNKVPVPKKGQNGYYQWSSADVQQAQSYKVKVQTETNYHFGG